MVQEQNPPISHILGNCKKCQTHSKFQEINDCIFFVIDKDEMLSCMEPEALKRMTNFKTHTQCLGF